jgi:hypothetical protein
MKMDCKRCHFLSVMAMASTLTAAAPHLAQKRPARRNQQQSLAPAKSTTLYNPPSEIKRPEFYNLRELEGLAGKIIPAGGFGYIAGTAAKN